MNTKLYYLGLFLFVSLVSLSPFTSIAGDLPSNWRLSEMGNSGEEGAWTNDDTGERLTTIQLSKLNTPYRVRDWSDDFDKTIHFNNNARDEKSPDSERLKHLSDSCGEQGSSANW